MAAHHYVSRGDCIVTPPGYFAVSKTMNEFNISLRAALPYVENLTALEKISECSEKTPSLLCAQVRTVMQ